LDRKDDDQRRNQQREESAQPNQEIEQRVYRMRHRRSLRRHHERKIHHVAPPFCAGTRFISSRVRRRSNRHKPTSSPPSTNIVSAAPARSVFATASPYFPVRGS